jgi:hypothetical protein
MTLRLAPPPLQVPAEFAVDKPKAAFFSSLLNTLYQLWTAVYGIRSTAKVTTTDATVTGLVRIPVRTNKTVMVQAFLVAKRTGGSSGATGDSAFYVLTGAYKNISGVLTGIGTPDLVSGEDQAGWNVGFSTSGEFAVITVTGAANNNITWEGTYSVYEVGA